MVISKKSIDRFCAKLVTDVTAPGYGGTKCRIWTGVKLPSGYGITWLGKSNILTHRKAWIIANRRSIPKGMIICHHCDNPPCCNPAHLFLGTHKLNVQDKELKGRANRKPCLGSKNGISKLTETEVKELRVRYSKGDISLRQLAKYYPVGYGMLALIVKRKKWKHVV